MNHSLLTFIFIILTIAGYSQINSKIKQKSDENSQKKKSGSSSYSYSDEDGSGDVGDCCGGCVGSLDLAFLIFEGLNIAQNNSLEKLSENSRISSATISTSLGQASARNWSLIPKVRIAHGIFGTELRVYQSFESHLEGDDDYSTVDWQILQFNLVNEKDFHWRIGTGFMFETYSGTAFNENSMAMDIYLSSKVGFSMELRMAFDYWTSTWVRQEFNTNVSYSFFSNEKIDVRTFVNFTGVNYYEEVKFNILSLGVKINLPFSQGGMKTIYYED